MRSFAPPRAPSRLVDPRASAIASLRVRVGLFDSIVEGVAKLIGIGEEQPAQRRGATPVRPERTPAVSESQAEPEPSKPAPSEPDPEPEPQPDPEPDHDLESEPQSDPEPQPDPEPDPRLSALLGQAMDALPKVVGVAIIDLDRDHVLAWEPRELVTAEDVAPLAQASRAAFETDFFAAIERSLCAESASRPQQLILSSDAFVHTLVRLEQYPSLALFVACHSDTNLGRLLTLLRGMRAQA